MHNAHWYIMFWGTPVTPVADGVWVDICVSGAVPSGTGVGAIPTGTGAAAIGSVNATASRPSGTAVGALPSGTASGRTSKEVC